VTGTAITNTIRKLRFERNEMTQQDLAERVGVTRQTINAIELGKYSPSLEVAFRIAAVFRVPLDQVFQYDGDRAASEKKKV
jgi:putative transcriptional regulator